VTTVNAAAAILLVLQKLHEATFILKKSFKKERQSSRRAGWNGLTHRLQIVNTQANLKFQTERSLGDGSGSPGHTAMSCVSRFPHEKLTG